MGLQPRGSLNGDQNPDLIVLDRAVQGVGDWPEPIESDRLANRVRSD
jgi:hypothetical protein